MEVEAYLPSAAHFTPGLQTNCRRKHGLSSTVSTLSPKTLIMSWDSQVAALVPQVVIGRRSLVADASSSNPILGAVMSMAQGTFDWEGEHRSKGKTGGEECRGML